MKCDSVGRLLADYELGNLPNRRAGRVREHLAACPQCRARLDELERVNAVLAAIPPAEPERDLLPVLRDRMARRGSRSTFGSIFSRRAWVRAAAFAAVLVLLVVAPLVLIDRTPQVTVEPMAPAAATYVSAHAALAGSGGGAETTMLAVYARMESARGADGR
jgi:anti-sigma factor RsiW